MEVHLVELVSDAGDSGDLSFPLAALVLGLLEAPDVEGGGLEVDWCFLDGLVDFRDEMLRGRVCGWCWCRETFWRKRRVGPQYGLVRLVHPLPLSFPVRAKGVGPFRLRLVVLLRSGLPFC